MGDEGGLAVASRRFLFTYNGQEYVWMKHRRFSGDNISCQNLSTGNIVAYYTNKMLPKKLQGILVIEPQVSSQDGFMSDYMVLTLTLHQQFDLHCHCAIPCQCCSDRTVCSISHAAQWQRYTDLQQSAVNHFGCSSGAGYELAAYAGSWLSELSRMAGAKRHAGEHNHSPTYLASCSN